MLAECWPPGEPTDREPAHTVVATFDRATRRWYAVLDTTGWVPGEWQVRTPVDAGEDGEGWAWLVLPVAA